VCKQIDVIDALYQSELGKLFCVWFVYAFSKACEEEGNEIL